MNFDQSSEAAPPNPSRNQSKSPRNAGISFKLIGKREKRKRGKNYVYENLLPNAGCWCFGSKSLWNFLFTSNHHQPVFEGRLSNAKNRFFFHFFFLFLWNSNELQRKSSILQCFWLVLTGVWGAVTNYWLKYTTQNHKCSHSNNQRVCITSFSASQIYKSTPILTVTHSITQFV